MYVLYVCNNKRDLKEERGIPPVVSSFLFLYQTNSLYKYLNHILDISHNIINIFNTIFNSTYQGIPIIHT